jgi:hypothetical protein
MKTFEFGQLIVVEWYFVRGRSGSRAEKVNNGIRQSGHSVEKRFQQTIATLIVN